MTEFSRVFRRWRDRNASNLFASTVIVILMFALVGLYHTGKFILGGIVWATWCGLAC